MMSVQFYRWSCTNSFISLKVFFKHSSFQEQNLKTYNRHLYRPFVYMHNQDDKLLQWKTFEFVFIFGFLCKSQRNHSRQQSLYLLQQLMFNLFIAHKKWLQIIWTIMTWNQCITLDSASRHYSTRYKQEFVLLVLVLSGVTDSIWLNCYCWGNWGMVEGRFSKWF